MSNYVHHIPGRLRVRCGAVRRDECRAGVVKTLLQQQNGIRSVEASTITGSIVVNYDPALTTHAAIIDVLRDCGYMAPPSAAPVRASHSRPVSPASDFANDVAKKVAAKLVQAAVERSLMALVTAVL